MLSAELLNSTCMPGSNKLHTTCQVIGDVLRIRQVFTNLVRYCFTIGIEGSVLSDMFVWDAESAVLLNMDTTQIWFPFHRFCLPLLLNTLHFICLLELSGLGFTVNNCDALSQCTLHVPVFTFSMYC